MNRNLILYEREVYTSLDWFGNLGGLSEGLKLLFGIIVGFFNYNYYNNYMVAKLFTYKSPPMNDAPDGPGKTGMNRKLKKRHSISSTLHAVHDKKLDPKGLNPCVMFFHKWVPRKFQ